jgi:hypothetical protein
MFDFLAQPYPFKEDFWERILSATHISLLIFVILLIFQPFGLNLIQHNKIIIISGYALWGWIVMWVTRGFIPLLFKDYYQLNEWTVGKEILRLANELFWIGLVNFLYTIYRLEGSFSFFGFMMFVYYTFQIGIIPLTTFVFFQQKRFIKLRTLIASRMSQKIGEVANKLSESNENILFEISGEEKARLNPAKIVLLSAVENQLKVVMVENNRLQTQYFYSEVKEWDYQIRLFPHIFKCNSHTWINLKYVKLIVGNEQGYQFIVDYVQYSVPVSFGQVRDLQKKIGQDK